MTTQRVNIQYSVDMKELPAETDRLLAKAHTSILECANKLAQLHEADVPLTIACLQSVDAVRINLTNADHILQDVQNIVSGYLSYMSDTTNSDEQALPLAPDKIHLDDLQTKLDNFREAVSQSGLAEDSDNTQTQTIAD